MILETDSKSGLKHGLKNELMAALDTDVDSARRIVQSCGERLGAVKIGPRLVVRYGAELIREFAARVPVFVDNKYLDIPSTMEAAIRATFEAGATFATVHALAGREALERLAAVERELNQQRPFKILAVTILTSFSQEGLPPVLQAQPIAQQVKDLAQLTLASGLTGLVCSPLEVASLRAMSPEAFLVTPGVRLPSNKADDQTRVETPERALRAGASALVVGRPIVEAKDPIAAIEEILASMKLASSPAERIV